MDLTFRHAQRLFDAGGASRLAGRCVQQLDERAAEAVGDSGHARDGVAPRLS